MYLLDTNVCVELIRGRPQHVWERFALAMSAGEPLHVSSVSIFELSYGAHKSDRAQHNLAKVHNLISGSLRILSLSEEDGDVAGEIRARLERSGNAIGPYDTLIAGQALSRRLTLVTGNVREFSRVEGLKIENWSR